VAEKPKAEVIFLDNKPTPEQWAFLLFGTSIRGMLEMYIEEESKKA
jgi:hypothetical protein